MGLQRVGHDIATKHLQQFSQEGWFVFHLPQGLQGPMGVNERKLLASVAAPGGQEPLNLLGKGRDSKVGMKCITPN